MATKIPRRYTPCLSLLRYVKGLVYAIPVSDIDDLKRRITKVIVEILRNTCLEIEYRVDILPATNKAHVEVI